MKKTLPLSENRITALFFIALAVSMMFGLRVLRLDSDPYPRLTWSSALLTDEGFYIHNARSLVLFGQERTDDFNNALLMPTLHGVQSAVFRVWGAGAVQARTISVAAGLLTLPIFFAAMRRAFSLRAACAGTLFLGLDHVPLLYSRMALMDTPAALLLTGAFYLWTRGVQPASGAKSQNKIFWLILCGAMLGLAFATRGLCAFVVPVPLLLSLRRVRREGRTALPAALALTAGLTCALALYAAFWAIPQHEELSRVNAYYMTRQLLPHSLPHLARIAGSFFFGDTRGMSPYLVRHTPVLFGLSLAGLAWFFLRPQERDTALQSEAARYLGGWLLAGWLLCGAVGYAPSRYYVLFYPALAGAAALAWERLPKLLPLLRESVALRTAFAGFFTYHIALALRPADSLPGTLCVAGITLFALFAASHSSLRPDARHPTPNALLLLWLLINSAWLWDWAGHPAYTQKNAEQWLTANLPPDAVLIGDAAPGLCMNSRFRAVPVIPGLCNDHDPVSRFAPAPRVIVIMDANLRERWWTQNYPALITPENRAALLPVVQFPVGIYRVPASTGR